jgi:4'-phosphopantetheinyl transferase
MINIIKNISKDSVIVYILNTDSHIDKLQEFLGYLSDIEKENAYNYKSELLVNRYIITHGFLRLILCWHIRQVPKKIQIKIGIYGKPFVTNSNIRFNISHSNNIVCYALTLDQEVGVDVEFQNRSLNFEDLLDSVLSQEEIQTFLSLEDDEKCNSFYALWTKKEAIIKATGDGLTYDITKIMTIPFKEKSKVTLSYKHASHKKELYCYPMKVLQNYTGFIAADR